MFCSKNIPDNLVGTDLLNNQIDLKYWAIDLLKQDGVDNFLDKEDVVFMMHQGYIFWYFKANGNSDPTVFSYHEQKLKPQDLGPLSNFLKQFT